MAAHGVARQQVNGPDARLRPRRRYGPRGAVRPEPRTGPLRSGHRGGQRSRQGGYDGCEDQVRPFTEH